MKSLIKLQKDTFFKGVYSGSGDLELYGTFEGVLKIDTIYIKRSGLFFGKLAAKTVVVEGKISADIEAEHLHLKPTGIIDGDLIYKDLIIDSGGLLNSSRIHNISNNAILKFNYSN